MYAVALASAWPPGQAFRLGCLSSVHEFQDSQDRHFSRRLKAAVEGLHLPSEEELLRGMNFFRVDLGEDIREYAERLWRRVRNRGELAFASLAAALEELTVEQSDDGVRSLVKAPDGVEEVKGVPIEACRLRRRFYLASSGDSDAAASITGEAAVVALRDINNRDDLRMVGRALAWAVMACSLAQAAKVDSLYASRRSLSRMLQGYERDFEEAIHAIARLYLKLGPIIEITIDAPEGGYTLGSVSQDEHTEEFFTAFLVAYLAGRAAEEEILGSATSNSGGSEQSDLALATGVALDMETVLGFSRTWPLLYRKLRDGAAILATDLELAQRVHARLTSAHKATRDIVRKQKTALQFLANILLAEETLEGPELDAVLEKVRRKMVDLPARQ